jgi:hypothetical protein
MNYGILRDGGRNAELQKRLLIVTELIKLSITEAHMDAS